MGAVVLITLINILKSERNFVKESLKKKLTSKKWDVILIYVAKTTEVLKWDNDFFLENKKKKEVDFQEVKCYSN